MLHGPGAHSCPYLQVQLFHTPLSHALLFFSPNVILGVTNPFFIKTFQNWPHIVRLGELKMAGRLHSLLQCVTLALVCTGIYTAYKTFLHKDKILIKRLLKGIQRKRPSEAQSAILRRHLLELTQSFIIPLTPPQVRPFNQDEFMSTLDHAGPQLTSMLRGDWMGLYRSPNFDSWYRQRHREMTEKLESLHLETICDAVSVFPHLEYLKI
ncbi:hypothetical protein XENOCAPTIV_003916 [Xenoophorus captivus]|uniref:Uncharacterized protein n=1 Tax=Xenoophorus captivus TaxID=1517983 RepID=A0ABV0RC10_9TELE